MLKAIHLEPHPFDMERDLITPTFKLKRPQLLKYYKVVTNANSCKINTIKQILLLLHLISSFSVKLMI